MSAQDVVEYLSELPLLDRDVLNNIFKLSEKTENKLVVAGTRVMKILDRLMNVEYGSGYEYTRRLSVIQELKLAYKRIYAIYWQTAIGSGILTKWQIPPKYEWTKLASTSIERVIKEFNE